VLALKGLRAANWHSALEVKEDGQRMDYCYCSGKAGKV